MQHTIGGRSRQGPSTMPSPRIGAASNMIELNATELGTWLQIVSAFAALQFVASALKNFRAARRLVPIGSVDPTMVEKYKTVPVCFVGSDNR